MASASVVSPHRLDLKPQLLVLKLPGGKKMPRKSSWEKMIRRGFGSGGECASVTAGGELGTHPLSSGLARETAVKGGMPGEGCGAPAAPAAPRSPDRDREEGSTDSAGHTTGCTRASQSAHITSDRNSNIECDSNHNTGGRRGSLMRSGTNVMSSASVANGHKGAQKRRDSAHGRRDSRKGDNGHRSISSSATTQESGGLPLERLTQGRTGVVRLARNERPRREAWSIFPQGVDPRVRTETGEGHRFEAKLVKQAWCDACPQQITAQAIKCQNCSYTCHLECESQVQVDCNQRDRQESPSPRSHCSTAPQHKKNEGKGGDEGRTKDLPEEEVRTRIDAYNAQVSENGMKLASDGAYTGFIKVHLKLSRPVTVPPLEQQGPEGASRQTGGRNPAPSEDHKGTESGQSDKRTSFYLPRNCVKQLHISSVTTSREVIEGLLKKFMVLDNPCKFALYRRTHRDGQDLFQKLPQCERPLLLRLIAGPDSEQLSFVLKENETSEVEWHAFSVPELQNFLVILEKEEAERVRTVEHKYAMYRKKLQLALQQHGP
ncbi:ras association domain-containing protein 5 isoform X1 [Scomber scombrus]|uniref:Ras association domain-containing protein 5 isoform X1 n=1 Tax=Scomber scombrus TaxID=13677 RepID=A0AAV1N9H2_SCOSC|nr:ras association domain-containing protein 5 isoform X1 [Scomber scombrus]